MGEGERSRERNGKEEGREERGVGRNGRGRERD